MNQNSGIDSGVGVIREVIRSAEYSQRAVAEELIDMPTGIDDSGYHDLKQSVQAGDGFLGSIRLGERGEVADIDKYHGHLAALTGEHIVTLLK
jgi:hypothetical protein